MILLMLLLEFTLNISNDVSIFNNITKGIYIFLMILLRLLLEFTRYISNDVFFNVELYYWRTKINGCIRGTNEAADTITKGAIACILT